MTSAKPNESESITKSDDINAEMEKKGIPRATFIEDVEKFLKVNNFANLQEAGQSFENMYRQYRLIEELFAKRRLRLMQQVPEIEKTLDVVRQLQKKNTDLDVNFAVASQLYAKAYIPKADKVGLWLGANVMLEYNMEEAEKILVENKESAQKSMNDVVSTLDFLKDQCTTVEVNLARLHNLSLKRSRQNPEATGAIKPSHVPGASDMLRPN